MTWVAGRVGESRRMLERSNFGTMDWLEAKDDSAALEI
jgi:hypothetical protein